MRVQADRQRVLRGVGAEPRRARRDDPLGQQRRRRRGLRAVVEVLKGAHERPERVVLAQQPHRGRRDPRHPLLASLGVGPAGAPQRVPVDRAVPVRIGGVGAAQPGTQHAELGRVLERWPPRPPAAPGRGRAGRAEPAARAPGVAGTDRGSCTPCATVANVPSARPTMWPSHSPGGASATALAQRRRRATRRAPRRQHRRATCRARPRSAHARGQPRRACRQRAAGARRVCVERRIGADEQRVAGVHAPPAARRPRIISGRSASQALIRTCCAVDVDRPRVLPARIRDGSPPLRRRRTSRSMTASVPAVRRCEPVGRRTAPSEVGELGSSPAARPGWPHRA